jgi:hypothetical protein
MGCCTGISPCCVPSIHSDYFIEKKFPIETFTVCSSLTSIGAIIGEDNRKVEWSSFRLALHPILDRR